MNSCEPIEVFYNIRTDFDKIQYASHITKIIQDVTNENDNCYKILQLYLNTLYMYSETDKNFDFILSVFKIKLLCLLGFKPRIEECSKCQTKENLEYFSIKNNGVLCEKCGKMEKGNIKISQSTYLALKFITLAPIKKVFNFELKNESLKELELLSKIYFNEKLEKEYKLEKI